MEFDELIRRRSSTRRFSDKPLEEEKLTKILEAGRVAPTAKNFQPQKILVARSPEALAKLDTLTPCRYGAPTVLIVCCDATNTFTIENFNSYLVDGSIVTTHMMLEAEAIGVNSLWVRRFVDSEVQKAFDLPENIIPVALLNLGYRADDCPASPNHGKRKSLSCTVEYI